MPQRYDPWDPGVLADPYPWYRWLHEEQPVYRAERGFTVLSRYDDVTAALRDHERFVSRDGTALFRQEAFPFIGEDPPEHTRRRKVGARALGRTAVARWAPPIRARAEKLVAQAVEAETIEAVGDLVDPLVTESLAEALGIVGVDAEAMVAMSEKTFSHLSGVEPPAEPFEEMPEAFTVGVHADSVIEERKRSGVEGPGDVVDAVIARAQPDEDGHRLSRMERTLYVTGLVGPGVETTRDLIGNALELAARFPDQWRRVLDGDAPPAAFVEEALRFESPVQGFFRTTASPVELSGTVIPEDERVLVLYGAANRDERAFEQADRFVADRTPNDHVAFGLGIHYCMGAALARAEAVALLETLAEQGVGVERAGDGRRTTDALVRGWRELPVSLRG